MIGSQQYPAIRHFVVCSVLKNVGTFTDQLTEPFQIIEIGIKSDFPECYQNRGIFQSLKFSLEIWGTIRKLLRERFVVGGSAAHGRGDVEIFEYQTVFAIGRAGLAGEPGFVE